ncbi:MAG: hypothetical protein L7U87_04980 [Chlamydiales bacterium]|nr:hypothetical protein [Chlamydiales bacterium]
MASPVDKSSRVRLVAESTSEDLSESVKDKEISRLVRAHFPDASKEARFKELVKAAKIRADRNFTSSKNDQKVLRHLLAMCLSCTVAKHRSSSSVPPGGSVFDQFGQPIICTRIEESLIQSMLNASSMATEDRLALNHYYQQLQQTRGINLLIDSLVRERSPEGVAELKDMITDRIMQELETSSNELILDFGLYQHAMRLAIKFDEEEVQLTLMDSRGAVEDISSISASICSMISTASRYLSGSSMRRTFMSVSCSRDYWDSNGKAYLCSLFHLLSGEHGLLEKENTERASIRLFADKARWERMLAAFRSLNPYTVSFSDDLTTIQSTDNCFAKRMQLIMRRSLGNRVYKRLSALRLKKIRGALLSKLSSSNVLSSSDLESIKVSQLSLDLSGLSRISSELSAHREVPMQEDLVAAEERASKYSVVNTFWTHVFTLLNHKIEKARAYNGNLGAKPTASIGGAGAGGEFKVEEELVTNTGLLDYEILAIVSSSRNKTRRIAVDISGERKVLSSGKFLKELEKDSSLIENRHIQRLLYFIVSDEASSAAARERAAILLSGIKA